MPTHHQQNPNVNMEGNFPLPPPPQGGQQFRGHPSGRQPPPGHFPAPLMNFPGDMGGNPDMMRFPGPGMPPMDMNMVPPFYPGDMRGGPPMPMPPEMMGPPRGFDPAFHPMGMMPPDQEEMYMLGARRGRNPKGPPPRGGGEPSHPPRNGDKGREPPTDPGEPEQFMRMPRPPPRGMPRPPIDFYPMPPMGFPGMGMPEDMPPFPAPGFPSDIRGSGGMPLMQDFSGRGVGKREFPVFQPEEEPPTKKKRSHKKKPADMPRRPLSAYNIFFSEEREVILKEFEESEAKKEGEELTKGDAKVDANVETTDEASNNDKKPKAMTFPMIPADKKRRAHRKSHGKIGFQALAKMIGKRWRELDEERRKKYQVLAQEDMKRQKQAMEEYYAKQNEAKEEAKVLHTEPSSLHRHPEM